MIKSFLITTGIAWIVFTGIALAANPFDITFPIPELGNCASQKECKAYCDEPAHGEACFVFAEKHGFVSKEDSQKVEKAKEQAQKTGPGGCQGEKQCRVYCEAPGHLDACLDFAVREGFMTSDEAARIREQTKRGLTPDKPGPGGCKGEECRAYCQSPEHAEECLKFAEANNLMSADELARAKKSLQALKKGGPGGCAGEKACRAYCENPNHAEECVNFAVENGFMPSDEAERARKFAQQSREGGPGGCRGEQCRAYCENSEHQKECFAFAQKNGLATEDQQKRFEAGQKLNQQVKETGGPGGCKDEQSCKTYCSEPVHAEECIAFAAIKGGVTPEEAKRMLDEFRKQSGGPMPQGDFRGGQGKPSGSFQGNVGEQTGRPSWQGGKPPAFPEGPGGCKGPEECIKYCSDPQNRDMCAKFGPAAGGMPPGGTFRQGTPSTPPQGQFPAGPGGCKSIDECKKYCTEHMDECRGMMPPSSGGRGQGFPVGGQFPSGTGMMPPSSGQFPVGPGGCRGPEECKKYCTEHMEECKNFMPPQQPGGLQQEMPQATTYPKPFPISQPYGSPVACPNEPSPVCGSDGRTYPNPCFAKIAGVPIAHVGGCDQNGSAPGGIMQPPLSGTTFPCPETYSPVCGTNNQTYPNECEAKKNNAPIAYSGQCRTEPVPAPMPYPQEQTGSTACPTFNEPACGTDGKTYQNGCFAKTAGVGVAYPGACRIQTESAPYAGNLLNVFGRYFKRVFYGLTL